jgi:hypothetical protein
MLDVGEVELARTLASNYETLGENAAGIAANVALAGLIGGLAGGVRTFRGARKEARIADLMDVHGQRPHRPRPRGCRPELP